MIKLRINKSTESERNWKYLNQATYFTYEQTIADIISREIKRALTI